MNKRNSPTPYNLLQSDRMVALSGFSSNVLTPDQSESLSNGTLTIDELREYFIAKYTLTAETKSPK